MKLEKFLNKYRIETRVKDDIEYRQVTISQHTGVRFRGTKLGSKIGRKRQFIVDLDEYPNTVMFTRQGLKDGAIGFAPKEVNKCIVTENMPTLSVNTEIVDIDYLQHLLNSNYFLKKVNELSIVGSAQKSIHERDLLKLEVDIPSIKIQKEIAKRIISKEDNFSYLKTEIQTQKQLLSQLKQAILQEAINGKLTQEWREQNPNTEPASKLLERIKAEKQQLIKDKKIRKEKPLPTITKEEIPFELPKNWVWVRLLDLCSKTGSGSTPRGGKSAYIKSGIKFIRSQNVYDDGLRIKDIAYISDEVHEKMKGTKVESKDLLLNITGGSIGRCCIVPSTFDTGNINQHVSIIRSIDSSFSCFLHKVICSNYFQKTIIDVQTGAGREGLPKNKMDEILIPFPTEIETQIIVEKVETLMQKCNELELEITQSEQHANMLMQAVLKEAFENKIEQETKVVQLPILGELEEKHFVKRKMLASYIINQSANDVQFGDTKFEKLLHLADYHILKRNFGQEYKQKAAGPYDNKFTYAFFQQTIKAGWFYKQPLGNMNRILQGKNNSKSQSTYDYFSNEELSKIDGLISTFKNTDYQKPEIISTLYAVWNNRLIRNQEITDELLKQDFLNWDKGKAQYVYPKDRVTPAIEWMNKNEFIPDGWGKLIEPPKRKNKKK